MLPVFSNCSLIHALFSVYIFIIISLAVLYQLSTVTCQLSAISCKLSPVNCHLSSVNCLLFAARYSLPMVSCHLHTATLCSASYKLKAFNFQMSTVNWLLSALFCSLYPLKSSFKMGLSSSAPNWQLITDHCLLTTCYCLFPTFFHQLSFANSLWFGGV